MLPRAVQAARRRFSSSLALPTSTSFEQPATNAATNVTAKSENVFEELTDDYKRIAIVDAGTTRNPTTSLIRLLREQRHAEARGLLKQFTFMNVDIPSSAEFASHALHILKTQGHDSDWLDWFAQSSRPTRSNSAQADKLAYSILVQLLKTNTPDAILPFVTTAARRGYTRSVLVHVLPWLTAHRPDLAEQVWQQALDHHHQRLDSTSMKQLGRLRNIMIRTAVQHSHFDHAIEMLDQLASLARSTPSTSTASTAPFTLARLTTLQVLSTFARVDRFDLFERAHDVFTSLSPELRLCNRPSAQYPLMLVRHDETDEAPMLAQEAFVALRGDAQTDLFEPDDAKATVGWRDPANVARDAELRAAVSADDLERAIDVLTTTLAVDAVPSLDATALFFELDADKNEHRFMDATLSLITCPDSQTKKWHRGFWASAVMLYCVRRRTYERGVELFMRIFETHSLPPSFVRRFAPSSNDAVVRVHDDVDRAVSRPESAKSAVDFGVPLHPHSVALAMQCAVPLLVMEGEWTLIDETYDSLVRSPLRFPILASSKLSRRTGRPCYDPYTFLPFLRAFAFAKEKQRRRAGSGGYFDQRYGHSVDAGTDDKMIGLLKTMNDQLEIDMLPPEHWTELLLALSRLAPPSRVYELVDHIEGKRLIPGLPAARTLKTDEEGEEQRHSAVMDAVAWTGIMGGFGRQRRYEDALEVGRMMRDKGYDLDPVWVETVRRVTQAAQRSSSSTRGSPSRQ